MTVGSTTSRMDYTGTGSVAEYSYTFKIFSSGDLLVTQRDTSDVETTLVLDTDYTVAGVGSENGGSITLSSNLTSGYHLTIRRVPQILQETDIRNQGSLYLENIESALDNVVHQNQSQQDEIDRSVKLSETTTGASGTLPAPSSLKVLRWNTAADALENVDPGSVALAVPADGSVTTAKITNGSVTLSKIASGAVNNDRIANSTITVEKLSSSLIYFLCPSGAILPYAGASAPGGWFLCDGQTTMGYSGSHALYNAFSSDGNSEDLMFPLYEILWEFQDSLFWNGSELAVTTKGASAAADWLALRAIAVPDLRGRTIIGAGTGSGLTARTLGGTLGAETHQLTESEMPAHTHNTFSSSSSNNTNNDYIEPPYGADGVGDEGGATSSTGGDEAHNNMQPSFVANWIIKL